MSDIFQKNQGEQFSDGQSVVFNEGVVTARAVGETSPAFGVVDGAAAANDATVLVKLASEEEAAEVARRERIAALEAQIAALGA